LENYNYTVRIWLTLACSGQRSKWIS